MRSVSRPVVRRLVALRPALLLPILSACGESSPQPQGDLTERLDAEAAVDAHTDARGASDLGGPGDAGSPSDQGPHPPCDGPDPHLPVCRAAVDCGPGEVCVVDATACLPADCVCDPLSRVWTCGATDPACGARSECRPAGGPCGDDFDCPEGFCEAGRCQRRCLSELPPVTCGEVPRPCATGQTLVVRDTCFSCVDARTCQAPQGSDEGRCLPPEGAPDAPCVGTAEAGVASCCRPGAEAYGAVCLRPGSAGGAAQVLWISRETLVDPCDPTLTDQVRIDLPSGLPTVGVAFDLGADGVEARWCPTPDQCATVLAGRWVVGREDAAYQTYHRVELRWPDGWRQRFTWAEPLR